MSNIQKTLDSLQPYVIGIRYLEGVPVIDTVFKDGWTVPESNDIKKAKGNDELNYYMIFSEKEGIGLDELLAYVDRTIKLNLDREKKHDLLKEKINELKDLFKKNSLAKLKQLKFVLVDEELVPSITDFDLDEEPAIKLVKEAELFVPPSESTMVEEVIFEDPTLNIPSPTQFLDEDGKAIPLSEEEQEMLAEEARAERFRQLQEANKGKSEIKKINNKKIELPPKKKIEMVTTSLYDTECDCGPDEACGKCINSKDL